MKSERKKYEVAMWKTIMKVCEKYNNKQLRTFAYKLRPWEKKCSFYFMVKKTVLILMKPYNQTIIKLV